MYPNPGAAYAPPAPSAPAAPSAPPAYGVVPGYEDYMGGGGAGGFVPPPAPLHPVPSPDGPPGPVDWNIPSLSEAEAKNAFLEYASSNCCYSSAPATDGVITGMQSFNTYRYRLETFTESRTTEWKTEPYTGQNLDSGPAPAPPPWAVHVQVPEMFKDHEDNVKVPNTSSVKGCHVCSETGQSRCEACNGTGKKECTVCSGSGKRLSETCDTCSGTGHESCMACFGNGMEKCKTCDGRKQIVTFINLKVEWKNNLEDYVAQQSSGMNIEYLSSVTGKRLFQDEQYMVYPVFGFPDPNLSQASEKMVQEHQNKFAQTSRIHKQKHTIELIPITKVNYSWKDNPHVYYVFGNELKVCADDYPATCCCCTIM